MINRIIYWSIEQRFLVVIATVMLIAVGLYSVKNTAVDAIPDLSDVQVIVKTSYPGQAPQVVQDQVTYPLTTALLSVPGAVTVRGYSFFGDSYVYVLFAEGTDLYWARSRVLEYLNQAAATLPSAAKPQLGPDATGVGWIYAYALQDKTGQHDLSQLRSLQDWYLNFELRSVAGVAEVAVLGGMVKQYQITLDPEKLRVYSIPLAQVQQALLENNQEVGASVVEMAEAEYMVNATGYLRSLNDIENIALGASVNGSRLRLKDIATVTVGPQMRRGIAELNGEGEVVGGIIVMRSGENAAEVIAAVKQKINSLKQGLPAGVEIVPVYDRSTLINSAVNNLWHKLLEELIVVALVCFIFLFHVRSSLVALCSLPIGILAAFIVMHWQGLNANIMSLGGIAIAIGAMIDGAIVLIENMHKHMERTPLTDKNRWQVVAQSASEVGPALFFSLLIITISFIPVFALEAQEGRMFSPLAYTKTYAMAAAAILAITLVPVLMGFFIRGKLMPEHKNPINKTIMAIYRPSLVFVLKRPFLVLAAALVIALSALWPIKNMGSEFMPDLNEGSLMYMPSTFPGISIAKARDILQLSDKLIRTVPEVETVFGKIGRAETATDPAPLTMVETFIQLKPKDQWRKGITQESLVAELDGLLKIPGVTNSWVMPIKTRLDMLSTGIKTPVGIKISGNNLEQLQKIGLSLEQLLPNVKGTASVYAERMASGRYLTVDIQRDKIARYGLSIAAVQTTLAMAVGGVTISQSVEGLERYPINVRFPQEDRNSPEQLQRLPLITPSGQHIALGDVANIYIREGAASIKSENARLTSWVYIDINAIAVGDYVNNAQAYLQKNLNLPAGYSITWSGQYEYMERAKQKLLYVVPLTLMIIFVLLFINFRSVSHVLLLLVPLPIVISGSAWLMYLLNFNFSMAVAVGMIALLGIAIETGVIMLVYLDQAWREFINNKSTIINKKTLLLTVIEGASLRARPVIMTATATIAGLLPILWGQGTGSEIMNRLAAPMVGGMLSTLLFTLWVLPVVYFLWRARQLP